MIDKLMSMKHWYHDSCRSKPKYFERKKPVSVPFFPPQFPYRLV